MSKTYKLRGPIPSRYSQSGRPIVEYLLVTESGEPCRLYGEPTYVASIEAAERAIRNLPTIMRPAQFSVVMEKS